MAGEREESLKEGGRGGSRDTRQEGNHTITIVKTCKINAQKKFANS